ncbi:hypothetical protein CPB86DRAFT_870856 [Serendipita vermifera]|nr:hypothetical protein CPB86DRAFT_870856 [Serendipita vermifera]
MAQLLAIPLPHPRHNPSRTEILWCQSAIKDLSGEISSLESQIRELTSRLVPLQKKRDNYASYISPFRRLPPEILTEIVTICLDRGVKLATMTQICGTVRNVVIGIPSVWSKLVVIPNDAYKYSTLGKIRCVTEEHIKTVLTRASSTPLKLSLDLQSDKLQCIISQNPLVHSLDIHSSRFQDILPAELERLNLSALKEICIDIRNDTYLEKIMDLAMQSTHEEMNIDITFWQPPTTTILQHGLFSRAENLIINFGWDEMVYTYSFMPANISLPRLRSLTFGRIDDPDRLDFSNLETFCSLSWATSNHLTKSSTPIALTKLSLAFVDFNFMNAATHKPYNLPHLKTLELDSLEIEGPLQEYFLVPNLQHLALDWVYFAPLDMVPSRRREESSDCPRLHSSILFSEGFLKLEALHIAGMGTDEMLTMKLRSCQKLDSQHRLLLHPNLHPFLHPIAG